MDPLSLFAVTTGLFALVFSVWVGQRVRRETARVPEPELASVCGCGHDLAMHNQQTNHCHAKVTMPVEWDEYSRKPIHWEHYPCECQQYIGPMPLAAFWKQLPGPQ